MDRSKFLVHLSLFLGLCVTTGIIIHIATAEPASVEALLRVSGPLRPDGDELTEFDIKLYRDTQASLLKSSFVITSALRQNSANQLPIVRNLSKHPVERLSSMLEVRSRNDGLLSVRIPIPWYRRSEAAEWEQMLDAIVDAYLREVINKERIEFGDQLATCRSRYGMIKQLVVKKGDELAAYQEELGLVDHADHWRVDYTTRKVEMLDAKLLDLQLKLMASEIRGDATEKALLAKQLEVISRARDENLKTLSNFGSVDGTLEAARQELEALKNDMQAIRSEMTRLEVALSAGNPVEVLQKARSKFAADAPSYEEIARSFEER